MDVLFHSVFIWPVQTLIEILYLVLNQWTGLHLGVTVFALSLAVNVLLLPIYLVADRWQKEEKALRDRMAPKLSDIRAVFRGDERQMIIGTYYRQQGFHPVFSLRSSVGLLIQIPFFLAAYNFLSHQDGFKTSVWLFQDFSLPDRLFHVGNFYVNVLPLVMTAFNLLSAFVYAKNLRLRDNVQLFLMSAVFLVLLYDSPAGLVLYWTFNNLFSLGKNLVSRLRRPGQVFHGLVLLVLSALMLWSITLRPLSWVGAVESGAMLVLVAGAPWLWKKLIGWVGSGTDTLRREWSWYRTSAVFLFVMSGVAVPLLFVAASPAETPEGASQVVRTAAQMFSLFVLLPLGLWQIASGPVRRLLCWGLGFLALLGLVSAFVFPPTVAFNASFTLTDPQGLDAAGWVASLAPWAVVCLVVFLAVRYRREVWIAMALGLGSASLVLVSMATFATLAPRPPVAAKMPGATAVSPVFHLTKTGHNQFVIFIDGFPAPAFPEMLATIPGFRESLEGFTWFANTVSYSPHTFQTTPAMMGGPEYTPEAINARAGVSLAQKHDEALVAVPRLLSANGERVVLTDPWYIDYGGDRSSRAFQGIPGVKTVNLHGVYSDLYFRDHPYSVERAATSAFDYDILARFSLFRMAPPGLRAGLYDDGRWWIGRSDPHVSDFVTGGYPNLVYLPQLSVVDEGPDSANFFFNEVFHDIGAFDPQGRLQAKSVDVPAQDLEKYGNVYSARNIYDGRAIMALVKQWIDWTRRQGVYDRTRIMIVADHGHPLAESKFGPRPWFRPLILFKDYDAHGPLQTNEDLKTDADVPSLLMAGMFKAIAPRRPGDIPLIHEGPTGPSAEQKDKFLFSRTMTLTQPDSRVPSHWVEVKP